MNEENKIEIPKLLSNWVFKKSNFVIKMFFRNKQRLVF